MEEITKKCTACSKDLTLSSFNKGRAKFNRQSWCRICQNEDHKKYRIKTKDHIKNYNQQYKLKIKQEDPLYWKRLRRRGRITRKTREKSAGPLDLSSLVVLENYNLNYFKTSSFSCEYCSSIINDIYDLEHVIPLCKNGTNKLENLVISCYNCNRGSGGKHNKLLEDWKPELVNYIQKRNIVNVS